MFWVKLVTRDVGLRVKERIGSSRFIVSMLLAYDPKP